VLAREQKKSLIDAYATHATDTGSPEVQIVSKRRRLLDYLKDYDSERYKGVITKLGIRK
jgi:small subunit ribosomal protein S15